MNPTVDLVPPPIDIDFIDPMVLLITDNPQPTVELTTAPVFVLVVARHVAQTPPRVHLLGLRVDVRGLLGHHASDRLGKLRSRTLRDLLHPGLVACTVLRLGPDFCHDNPVLLPHLPRRHHRVFLRHDHIQSEVISEGDLQL